jgi:hypothetical protein
MRTRISLRTGYPSTAATLRICRFRPSCRTTRSHVSSRDRCITATLAGAVRLPSRCTPRLQTRSVCSSGDPETLTSYSFVCSKRGCVSAYASSPSFVISSSPSLRRSRRPTGKSRPGRSIMPRAVGRRPVPSPSSDSTPFGLFSATYTRRRCTFARRPSTVIRSAPGSALSPSCVRRPLTLTWPCRMSCSHARLEPNPARARTFCTRSRNSPPPPM